LRSLYGFARRHFQCRRHSDLTPKRTTGSFASGDARDATNGRLEFITLASCVHSETSLQPAVVCWRVKLDDPHDPSRGDKIVPPNGAGCDPGHKILANSELGVEFVPGGGSSGRSFHQAIDAFQGQHQPQRHADFQQVFLAFGCFRNLSRDMPPSRLAAVLRTVAFVEHLPLTAVDELKRIAHERFGKSVLALAVRWVLDQGPTIAMWGARNPSQLDAISDVDGWHIDPLRRPKSMPFFNAVSSIQYRRPLWRRR